MNKFLPVLLNVFLLAIFATQAKAASGDASFTPTGFKIPIMKITISKNTGSVGSALQEAFVVFARSLQQIAADRLQARFVE